MKTRLTAEDEVAVAAMVRPVLLYRVWKRGGVLWRSEGHICRDGLAFMAGYAISDLRAYLRGCGPRVRQRVGCIIRDELANIRGSAERLEAVWR